tara:strand:+ start:7378 stop:8793 length:1416 start_codon:yes stop_codon:yes gene_type:complete
MLLNKERDIIIAAPTMASIRKPKFVDNALYLGEVNSATDDKKLVTVKQRKRVNYAIASEKAYTLIEEQGAIIIKQPQTHGHNYDNNIVYLGSTIQNDAALNKPPLLYSKLNPDMRIVVSSVQTSTEGTKFSLRNMKGKSLLGIGFTDTQAHFGQPIDVGLRTTDLALRLSRDIDDTLTSVNIARPMTPTNNEFNRRLHSHQFLAQDFYSINLMSALRFIGRHDGRIINFDRYGNLMYVPFNFAEGGRFVDHNARSGPVTTNPVDNISNRVMVEGVPLALNEMAFAEVNDSEKQIDGNVVEEPQIIGDFTVKTNKQARDVGRNVLKANAILSGNKSSNGHPKSWDLRPGTIIEYEYKKYIITEVRHRLSEDVADIVMLSVDRGIEGVLQGILMGTSNTGKLPDNIFQIKEDNLALFSDLEILSSLIITSRGHGIAGDGFIIGRAMGRGVIGATSGEETIGGSKTITFQVRGD